MGTGRWIKVFDSKVVTSTTDAATSSVVPLFGAQGSLAYPGPPSNTSIKLMKDATVDGALAYIKIQTSSPAAAVTVSAKLQGACDSDGTVYADITGGAFTAATTGSESLRISGPLPLFMRGYISVASATTCTATVDLWVHAKE